MNQKNVNQKNVNQKNVELSRNVFYHYFCDENGDQYSDHPDLLCVSRDEVVKQFPQTANWPIVKRTRRPVWLRFGSGIYLFPGFDFESPSFETV